MAARAKRTETPLDQGWAPAQRVELERLDAEVLGRFTGRDGEHRCRLAFAGSEALAFDLPPRGPALCLAWVGGELADARAEGEALYASYAERARDEPRPLCRPVGPDEVARLRTAARRAA